MKIKKGLLIGISLLTITGCASGILATRDGTPHLKIDDKTKIGAIYYLPKALIPVNIKLQTEAPQGGGDNTAAATDKKDGSSKDGGQSANTSNENKSSKQYVVTIGATKYIPDMRRSYVLEYIPELGTSDKVTISIGSNQLLQTNSVESKDETGDIAIKLAQTAAEAAKFAVLEREVMIQEGQKKKLVYACKDLQPFNIDTFIDPSFLSDDTNMDRKLSIGKLNKDLKDRKVPIEFKLNLHTEPSNEVEPPNKVEPPSACSTKDEANCYDKEKTGVLLRAQAPYYLRVEIAKDLSDENKKMFYEKFDSNKHKESQKVTDENMCLPQEVTQDYLVMAPNHGHIYALEVNRARFVNKKTELTITDGILNKIYIEKPSELLGFVSILPEALKTITSAIIPIPAQPTSDANQGNSNIGAK